jgi:hypothetical protein
MHALQIGLEQPHRLVAARNHPHGQVFDVVDQRCERGARNEQASRSYMRLNDGGGLAVQNHGGVARAERGLTAAL